MSSCEVYCIVQVLSVGMDGKILVWTLDKDKGKLTFIKGYALSYCDNFVIHSYIYVL